MKQNNEKEVRFQDLSKIEESEKNKRRSTWLMRIVVVFLILVFLGGIAWGANDLVSREGVELPPDVLAEIAVENAAIEKAAPKTALEMLGFISEAESYSIQEKPQLRVSNSFKIDQETVSFYDGNTQKELDAGSTNRLTAAFALMRPALQEQLSGIYENRNTQFGESIEDLLWKLDISEADLAQGATCTYNNYICTAYGCGHTENQPPDECPSCGAKDMYELQYLNNYSIMLPFAENSEQTVKIFQTPTASQLMDLLETSLGENISAQDATISPVYDGVFSCVIERAQKDNEQSKLQNMQFDCTLDVRVRLSFAGELSELGSIIVAATLNNKTRFDFDWPNIKLNENQYSLEKRDGVTLKVTQVAPEGTEVLWKSSDENAVTVDAQGNVSAGKTIGVTAEITAYMELDGVIYQDICLVSVKKSVDKIKLGKKKLSLQTGESVQLKVSVSPRSASFKDVRWFSRDEKIATVDQKGNVTALSSGIVEIFALSVDGNQKSTCTITVEGGA